MATAAALAVTEPASTGIGGDMFCLFYDAKQKRTRALNGSGRSASKASLQDVREALGLKDGQKGVIPRTSGLAVSTPGAAAGWVDTVEKFGSGKLSLQQILQPAIDLAEEGFAVHQISAKLWVNHEDKLRKASINGAEMLKPDDLSPQGLRAPYPGEVFKNANMAKTFRLLAEKGKAGFYEGPVADAIVQVVKEQGGVLSLDDLRHHAQTGSQEVDPIAMRFHGQGLTEAIDLWEHPPNGQGLVALIALGVLGEMEKAGQIRAFEQKDHNSVEYLHALIEALRIGFTEASWHVSDTEHYDIPVKDLLSEEYLKKRASEFSAAKAIDYLRTTSPAWSSSDTVYFAVTDPEGNAASFINSVYHSFGSAIIPKGTGFCLQDRAANFALGPKQHPNVYAPRKRPYHTIIPAMITNADGTLNTCYGVMGGFMQPQGHIQVFMNMFVFGMNPQEALDAPRICLDTIGTSAESKVGEHHVDVEPGIATEILDGLRQLGHSIRTKDGYPRNKFGRGQVIRRSVDNGQLVWSAGSDLRGDGHASPL